MTRLDRLTRAFVLCFCLGQLATFIFLWAVFGFYITESYRLCESMSDLIVVNGKQRVLLESNLVQLKELHKEMLSR